VLVALAVASQDPTRERQAPITAGGGDPRAILGPVAAPQGALSSTSYCAGGTAKSAADPLDATVVIANPGAAALTAHVTVFPGAQDGDQAGTTAVAALQPVARDVPVPARGRAELHLADVQASPFAAALVEVDGGGVVVERRVSGVSGRSTSPCAASPSATWYLPTGVTTKDSREQLALFNPFPDPAIVDVSFITSDGFRAPPAVQGYVVPGRHVSVVEVSGIAGRHEQVSTEVRARSGRLVVDRLQAFDGTDPAHPKGAAATLGAPELASAWTFPEGLVAEGINETYTVLNPSDRPAEVQLEVTLDAPESNGVVDPIKVTVPQRAYVQVAMKDQTRVPRGIGHSVIVRSTNGVAVVPERVITAAAPAARAGYGPALGAPFVATRWLLADGRADATTAEFLVLANPGDQLARVKVTALAQGQLLAVDGLQDIEVPGGGRVSIELGTHVNRADLSLLVESDRPVVAERGLYAASGPGLSLAVGIPLVEGVAFPPPPITTTTTTAPPEPASSSSS
jgi:hypothetical protein